MSLVSHHLLDLSRCPKRCRTPALYMEKGIDVGTHVEIRATYEVQPSTALWHCKKIINIMIIKAKRHIKTNRKMCVRMCVCVCACVCMCRKMHVVCVCKWVHVCMCGVKTLTLWLVLQQHEVLLVV